MLKKGLIAPVIIVVAVFVVLSVSMILLQEKKLTGFAVLGTNCNQLINSPGFYEMNDNIPQSGGCHNKNGINIAASDVILDCKGHSITGDQNEYTTGINVTSNSYTNITIINCSIINFDLGINTGNSQVTIADTSITGNSTQNCESATPTGCVCGSYTDGGGNGGCLSSSCFENIVNSTPTNWINVGCVETSMNQSRNFTEYDVNNCGTFTNITHYEYRLLNASLANVSTDWINVGCSGNNMNQSRNITQYDSNNLGCYQNETFVESQLVGPEWLYTSWSDWQNLSCINDNMNQTRSRIKYDSYSCAENITENESQLVGPNYVNVSISSWTDFSCVNSSTKNQSRIITQQDSYSCASERNITEYQSVSCSSGYVCSNGECVASSSDGGGGGGGGGSESCSNECSSGAIEKSCVNSTTIKTKTCGNYDSDSCLEWSDYSYNSCSNNEECKDGSCIKIEINCTNECNTSDYPRCKDDKTAELCLLNSSSNCYYIKEDSCSEKEKCVDGTCKIKTTQEIKEETPTRKYYGSGLMNLTKPSQIIPHGDIPEVVVDTATYTAGTAIVVTGIHFLWLWLISLFLPFFLLRLRHFCLAFIDTKSLLPFVKYNLDSKGKLKSSLINKAEIERFINILQKQFKERIIFTEATSDSYRFLFEKSGFIEIQLDSPIVINAHFSSSSRTKHFKLAFLNTIKILYGTEIMNKISKSLILTKESTSMISALRNISRERKLRKLSKKFKK